MPSWKKIITSGSSPNFSQITVDNTVTANAFSGIFQGALSSSAQIATQISGSFTSTSSSLASRITTAESELGNTLISSSAQIATQISGSLGTNASVIRGLTNASISGSFTDASSSLASRITTNEGYLNQSVKTDASPTFVGLTTTGDVTVQGTLTAETYIVSSSVTYMTSSFSSGSTIFGDSADDTHTFTGEVILSGSTGLNVKHGNISGSSTSTGSFGHILKGGVNWDTAVSSSAAAAGFGTGGGGSFTAAGISGSFTTVSSSLASRISTAESELGNTLISGSGQIATAISGAFTSTSSSLASRITTAESELGNTLISSSAQIATQISGAFGNQRVGTTDNVTFNRITTTGPDVFGGNVTIVGNLTLQGSQSAAETLVIADQFAFFASGSEGEAVDSGMLVQSGSSAMTGSAMYHDVHDAGTVRNLNGGRWAVAKDVKADDVVTTPKAFVTTVVTATDANDPDSTDVHYGVGEMYVNSDGEIWIYTGS
jgi:hypothetical protein